jgi:hypothetical protein
VVPTLEDPGQNLVMRSQHFKASLKQSITFTDIFFGWCWISYKEYIFLKAIHF